MMITTHIYNQWLGIIETTSYIVQYVIIDNMRASLEYSNNYMQPYSIIGFNYSELS